MQTRITCKYEFKLNINNIPIQTVNFLKYLEAFINSK